MKSIVIFLIPLLFAHHVSVGQIDKSAKTAGCWFSIMLEEDTDLLMGIEPKTVLALALQRPDKEASSLMEASFLLLKTMLKEKADFELLEVNAMKGKIQYSGLGYPLSSLKKAAKKGSFDQYVKIEILVSGAKRSSTQGTIGEAEVVDGIDVSYDENNAEFFPQIDITLKFADKAGNKTAKLKGRYRHTEKISINSESLSVEGFSFAMNRQGEVIPYYQYLQLAIEDLISQL